MRSVKELMDLRGRRAIVVGGAGHIGIVASEALVELGASVAILDIEMAKIQESESLAGCGNGHALTIICDLLDEVATRRIVGESISRLGGLDIFVHCASYVGNSQMPGWAVPLEMQTVEAWDKALRVNLTSGFVVAQEARKALAESQHGAIIFLSSIYGLVAPDMSLYAETNMVNPVGYGASKGGLLQLTRYLAALFGPHIRVNAISPGGVWRRQPENFHRRYAERTPLKRMASEEDLKGAVAYLASDLSAYVTGHNLVVDGGWTAW